MKNTIKKAPVKFWEDLMYFQHFMQIFFLFWFLLQISDYHHDTTGHSERKKKKGLTKEEVGRQC